MIASLDTVAVAEQKVYSPRRKLSKKYKQNPGITQRDLNPWEVNEDPYQCDIKH